MKFSQRMGITSFSKKIQIEEIDEELRIGLWNILHNLVLERLRNMSNSSSTLNHYERDYANSLWHDLFKMKVDTIPSHTLAFRGFLEGWFFNKATWHEIYDFVDFTVLYFETNKIYSFDVIEIERNFNSVLEREFSGFRFINKILAPIVNPHEIAELDESFLKTEIFTVLNGCNIHLKAALSKLSDRINPDYRNSIKESISAVESLAKIISGKDKDSLGASLDKLRGKINLHPALERGFKQLYGYTSDEGGIRHALMETSNCDFEDAKFMLISCSAFINYLIVKANKAGFSFE